MRQTLLAGPRLKVRINGIIAGYVSAFSYSVGQGQKLTYGVDSPFPTEIAQGGSPSNVTGSMTVWRPMGASPESWGLLSARSGDSVASAVVDSGTPGATMLGTAQYTTIEILDRESESILVTILDVMFASQSWSVEKSSLMRGTVEFQGRFVVHPVPGGSSFF